MLSYRLVGYRYFLNREDILIAPVKRAPELAKPLTILRRKKSRTARDQFHVHLELFPDTEQLAQVVLPPLS